MTSPGSPTAVTFSCPACKASYRWKAELTGRRIRCKHCQAVFAPEAPRAAVAPQVGHPGALGARSGILPDPRYRRSVVAEEQEETTVLHNWILPLIALGVGVALRSWQLVAHAGQYDGVPLWQSGLMALAEWIAVSIALGGGVFAGSLLGVEIERVGPAVLKPVAMALLMMAGVHFCSMVDQVPGDSWSLSLSIPLVFLLAFFMFAGMFKADLAEGGIAAVIAMVLVCGIGLILAMNVDGELGRILGFGRPA